MHFDVCTFLTFFIAGSFGSSSSAGASSSTGSSATGSGSSVGYSNLGTLPHGKHKTVHPAVKWNDGTCV